MNKIYKDHRQSEVKSAADKSRTQQNQQPSHVCQYHAALLKANKSIMRKNRQIETLNRIIKNLKADNLDLNNFKQNHKLQWDSLKKQLQKTKQSLQFYQLKQIQIQRTLCQERLEKAVRNKQRGHLKRNKQIGNHPQYYSQCHISRNTHEDPNQIIIEQPQYSEKPAVNRVNNNHVIGKKMTMGELFMGRKMKIQAPNDSEKVTNWGKIDELRERKKVIYGMHSYRPNQMRIQQALNFLKKQNQQLKIPIF